jgi:hypothetical protein
MITREQVADLQPGDVVELVDSRWLSGTTVRGPLESHDSGALFVGDHVVRHSDGRPNPRPEYTLTVVART